MAASRPLILFVCVHNAGRSRMAEAFFNAKAKGKWRAISAGTEPAPHPHPEVVETMQAAGVPLQPGQGRMLTAELADSATRVIGMGCDVDSACPALSVPLEDWELEDPKGRTDEDVAQIRDEIERRVDRLISELGCL